MYSHVVDGKVLDFKYKKSPIEGMYHFYIGDLHLGTITNFGYHWAASSCNPDGTKSFDYGVVKGFKTRLDAAEFLVQIYHKNREFAQIRNQHGIY